MSTSPLASRARSAALLPSDGRFVGQSEGLGATDRALRAGRSVVLVGPPGVGKSRLASEYVRRRSDVPVRVVRLSEVTDTDRFLTSVAALLDVARPPNADTARVVELVERALSPLRDSILVLDNFEQLPIEADALVARWTQASGVTLLVTSRRRVAFDAETVEVAPLAVQPRTGAWSDAASLLRARAAEIGRVEIEEDEADAMHAIARALDGLPLALELAAARLGVVSPTQLAHRLSAQLEALGRVDERDGLHAAIAASHALLSDEARACLVACAVFRGGMSLEALEAVAGPEVNVIEALQTLRNHSMLLVDRIEKTSRYDLAASIRAFVLAVDREDEPRHAARRARHARHFTDVAAASGANLVALRREVENLRLAFETALEMGPPADAAALALVLSDPTFELPYATSREILARVLDHAIAAGAEPTIDRRLEGELHLRRGTVRRFSGDLRGATEDLTRARELAEAITDTRMLAESLAGLGNTAAVTSDWTTGRAFLERAVEVHPSPAFAPIGLIMVANTYSNENDHATAEPMFRRGIELARARGDKLNDAIGRLVLGTMLVEDGNYDAGFAELSDALAFFDGAPSGTHARHWRAIALTYLARIKQSEGNLAGALLTYHRALASAEAAGVHRAEAVLHYFVAMLSLEMRELAAAEEHLRLALPLVRETCPDHEGAVIAARGTLFAMRGAHDDAERFYARAADLVARYNRPLFVASVAVMRGADVASLPAAHARSCEVQLAVRLRGAFGPAHVVDPIYVSKDAAFFRASESGPVSLQRRQSLRRVLLALVDARAERPGVPVALDVLVAQGWPGERVLHAAGIERVYAAIATLRKLGLRGKVEQSGDGYVIPASVPVLLYEVSR